MIAATAKPAHWTGFGGSLKPALAAAAAPRPARLPTPPALIYARRRVPPRCRRGSPLRTEATAHLTLVAGLRQALRPSLTSSLGGSIACLGRERWSRATSRPYSCEVQQRRHIGTAAGDLP